MSKEAIEFIRKLADKYNGEEYADMEIFFEEGGDVSDFGHAEDCFSKGMDTGNNEVYHLAHVFLEDTVEEVSDKDTLFEFVQDLANRYDPEELPDDREFDCKEQYIIQGWEEGRNTVYESAFELLESLHG